jgi:hypothetical protein
MTNFEAKGELEQQSQHSTLRFHQSKHLDLFLPVSSWSVSVLGSVNNVDCNPSDQLTVDRDWVSNIEQLYNKNHTQRPQILNLLVGILKLCPIEEIVKEIVTADLACYSKNKTTIIFHSTKQQNPQAFCTQQNNKTHKSFHSLRHNATTIHPKRVAPLEHPEEMP